MSARKFHNLMFVVLILNYGQKVIGPPWKICSDLPRLTFRPLMAFCYFKVYPFRRMQQLAFSLINRLMRGIQGEFQSCDIDLSHNFNRLTLENPVYAFRVMYSCPEMQEGGCRLRFKANIMNPSLESIHFDCGNSTFSDDLEI